MDPDPVSMEGFPVMFDCDIFLKLAELGMDCDFDQFDDVDDSVLSALSLDFPLEVEPEECTFTPKSPRDTDSGIDTQDIACNLEDDTVAVPKEFPFPFKPYDIQVGFMQELYKALELGKIGIFESPTGTGKSLSLICGALTWLRDFEEKQKQELEALLNEQDATGCTKKTEEKKAEELDWISAFAKKQENNEKTKKLKEEHEARLKREKRLEELRNNLRPDPKAKRKHDKLEDDFEELFKDASKEVKEKLAVDLENCENLGSGDDDETIVVAEYESDGEGKKADDSDEDEDDNDETHITKIYYCSRTHSQLAQFVREIQKSPFGEDTKVVSLGSRQNLCVNEAVKKLQSLTLMNDRCLELQRNKNKSEPKRKTGGEAAPKKKKVPTATLR